MDRIGKIAMNISRSAKKQEPIKFKDLIDAFEDYGFDWADDRAVVGPDGRKGVRYELAGNGDFDGMMNHLKEVAMDPDRIIPGSEGHHRYAPELTRKSVIVLQ